MTAESRKVRLLVVDDHAVVRHGLRLMLEPARDVAIVAEADNATDAMARVREGGIDMAIVDVNLPGRSGLELLRIIKEERPRLPVLVFSIYTEDAYAVRAVQLGAAGYLNKDAPPEVLLGAIRKAASGGRFITPSVAERLAAAVAGPDERAPHERLTEREFEVMRHIVSGRTLVDAAAAMNVSPKTITAYRTRILEKTGFATNAELVRYAYERRLF
jgi:DNA-binding NarL/FixJ family response regulator